LQYIAIATFSSLQFGNGNSYEYDICHGNTNLVTIAKDKENNTTVTNFNSYKYNNKYHHHSNTSLTSW